MKLTVYQFIWGSFSKKILCYLIVSEIILTFKKESGLVLIFLFPKAEQNVNSNRPIFISWTILKFR